MNNLYLILIMFAIIAITVNYLTSIKLTMFSVKFNKFYTNIYTN